MYCPECESEYREGFTRCSDCDVDLVEQLTASPEDPAHDSRLVRLRSYSGDGDAFLARSVLESAGIEALLGPPRRGDLPRRSFGIGLPGTDLFVRSEDFPAAEEILATVEGEAKDRESDASSTEV